MQGTLFYLTHPNVLIDPNVPVPRWPLNDEGRRRATIAATLPCLSEVTRIACSTEQKAQDTAAIIAATRNLPIHEHPQMGENDRSATGFLPEAEFQQTADAFFARPQTAARGWETAEAAQNRILQATNPYLADDHPGDTLLIGHGAVGTLLWCALNNLPISRQHDQKGGAGGCLFAYTPGGSPTHPWATIEELSIP